MTLQIEWSPKAAKNISKLPQQLIQKVLQKIEKVKENPFLYLEHFEGKFYKLRIGEYRALIDIDTKRNTLMIQVFDHRKKVYKR